MDWQTILLSAVSVILTGLATWGVERLVAFLNTKIKNTQALKYLTDAISIVSNAVKATYQTYVEALKNNNIFEADAQKEALNKALQMAESQMSTELKNYITQNFGDITEWITSQIEASLYDLKKK